MRFLSLPSCFYDIVALDAEMSVANVAGKHPSAAGRHPSGAGCFPAAENFNISIEGCLPSVAGRHPSGAGEHPSTENFDFSIENTLPSEERRRFLAGKVDLPSDFARNDGRNGII